ncbi:capsid staple protein [Maridesulfovibrio sp.]|uniref:capsid staple protein n=1 Tax=Maridesulfovibrio sp. TaxID=2795000 RepID=UPI0029F5996A|nr:hypothetical protein [Maridesulfovibrio sp.]
MKLVDMRRKPEKKKGKDSPAVVEPEHEDFPWGLRLSLDDEVVSKLGLKPSELKVGSTVKLEAKAFVCGARAQPDGKDKHIELQLVKLGIDTAGSFEDGFNEGAEDDD